MGYIEEKNGNKYFKEVLKKCTELWDELENLIECNSIEKINNKPGEFEKDFMKIKFNSDNNLLLNKILKLC